MFTPVSLLKGWAEGKGEDDCTMEKAKVVAVPASRKFKGALYFSGKGSRKVISFDHFVQGNEERFF